MLRGAGGQGRHQAWAMPALVVTNHQPGASQVAGMVRLRRLCMPWSPGYHSGHTAGPWSPVASMQVGACLPTVGLCSGVPLQASVSSSVPALWGSSVIGAGPVHRAGHPVQGIGLFRPLLYRQDQAVSGGCPGLQLQAGPAFMGIETLPSRVRVGCGWDPLSCPEHPGWGSPVP